MIDKIYSIYERNIKYVLLIVPIILFIVMAILYLKSG